MPEPEPGGSVEASLDGNELRLTSRGVGAIDVWLDARLIDPEQPVRVRHDGREFEARAEPRFADLCRSTAERGDPKLAFARRIRLGPRK